ncbi:MAG: hypothetical protein D6698_16395 [Gammaproteobacteria bacterium]|nr:MAG: hypothetical protein D6698_16395 [Gammaproteobacteria bacterium]
MSLGIECLLATDTDAALQAARTLDKLNQERRAIETRMKEQALQHLSDLQQSTTHQDWTVCLYHPDWHQGVIGIVAARVKDSRFRPTIVFADDQEGMIKGSARSIPGYHIRDALDRISRTRPGLIVKFGGHAMAAGLTIHQSDLDLFRQLFEDDARTHLNEETFQIEILSEGDIEPRHLRLDTVRILKQSEPWGQEFGEPVFDDVFMILTPPRITARQGLIQVSCQNSNSRYEAATFKPDILKGLQAGNRVRIAYRMDINRYCRPERLRLMIEHIEPFQEERV